MNKFLFILLLLTCLFSQKIYLDEIKSIEYGNSIEIDIFTDLQGSSISSYTLFYKKDNQSSYFRTDLTTKDGIYYSAIIPQEFINTDDIYYFIELTTESNSVTIPSIDPHINPLKIEIVEDDNNSNQLVKTNLINNFNIISPLPNSIVKSNEIVISTSYYQLENIDIKSIKIFIDGIDFTSKANIKEKYFILIPKGLKEGIHNINITFNNKSGKPYDQINWSFITNDGIVYEKFKYSGKVFHNYFNNNVEDNVISYNTSNLLFKGSAEWIDFDIKIKETTLENINEQSKNRYNISLRNRLIDFNYGDFYPQFDELTLNGSRVRGMGFNFHSRFFQLYLIKGQLKRAIQAQNNESLLVTLSEEYNEYENSNVNILTLSRYGYTFANEITALRLALGNYKNFDLGLNLVKVKDDVFSVDKYTENSIIDLNLLTEQYNSSIFIDKNNNNICDDNTEWYDNDGDGVNDECTSIIHIIESPQFVIYEKNIVIIGFDENYNQIKQEVWNIHVNYEDLESVLEYSFNGQIDYVNYLENQWSGDYPEDNLVIGSNMKINFNKVNINSSVGFSFYNQNIWDPIITQQELYTDNYDDCYYNRSYNQAFNDNGYYWDDCILFDSNDEELDSDISEEYITKLGESIFDLPNPEDLENFFHMNSSLLPTLPFSNIIEKSINNENITFRDFFESPEVAYNIDVRLSYPIHNINFGLRKVGISFKSLSNPYLQSDILEKYISNRMRFFNNKIFLLLSWKSIANGLTEKSSESNIDKYDISLSLYPHKKLPTITFNYGFYMKESGGIIPFEDGSQIDNRLNTETNNFNIYVSYNFNLFNYNHNIGISFYESEKIDLIYDEIIAINDDYLSPESQSNNYNLSLKNIFNDKWNTDIYISNSNFTFSKKNTEYFQEQDIQTYRIGFKYNNKRIIHEIGFWVDYSMGEGTSDYSQYGIKLFLELNVYKNLFMDIHLRNYNKNLYIESIKGSYDNSIAKINIAYKF